MNTGFSAGQSGASSWHKTIQSTNDTPYYENWLNALETLLAEKGIVDSEEFLQSFEALKPDH